MNYLIDSNALLFAASEPERLSARALSAITDESSTRFLSDASCWEIAIKFGIGKLQLKAPLSEFISIQSIRMKLEPLAITRAHIFRVASLPHVHGDPFDRLLAAQSLVEGFTIISVDAVFDAYGVDRIW